MNSTCLFGSKLKISIFTIFNSVYDAGAGCEQCRQISAKQTVLPSHHPQRE
jgi:hypothetical protein